MRLAFKQFNSLEPLVNIVWILSQQNTTAQREREGGGGKRERGIGRDRERGRGGGEGEWLNKSNTHSHNMHNAELFAHTMNTLAYLPTQEKRSPIHQLLKASKSKL